MSNELKKSLGPWRLWGLGVGYVISGMYFGWNLGLPEGGVYGMIIATIVVTIMYLAFVLSYSELACSIPRAGGAFVYSIRAFGDRLGFVGGIAQIIEYVFAPPAIALAMGAYFSSYFPEQDAMRAQVIVAIAAYVLFTGMNIWGVDLSANFELVITILAVAELLIFATATLPSFSLESFSKNPLPKGWGGIFAAIPFAIWFYLAIEGVANVAEESINPQRNISRGFIMAMLTLVGLALLIFVSSVGVAGWEAIVYDSDKTMSDKPLPLALGVLYGESHWLYRAVITVGLFGLIASFHGIILIAGRATFEFGRYGFLPRAFGKTLDKRKTPAVALVANMVVGIIALLTGKTGEIITIAVFGALSLYIMSMLSLLKLRKSEPGLERPYKTPFYPVLPLVALVIAIVCLVTLGIYQYYLALVYISIVVVVYLLHMIPLKLRERRARS